MVKRFKYNFILVSLIVIIGFVVGTSNGFLLLPDKIENEEPTVEEPTEEDDEEIPVTSEFTPPAKDASAYERIFFAFKILREGKGYQSTISQEVTAPATVQKVYIKQYRGEGYNLNEQWMEANISMGKFGFLSVYSDGNVVKEKKITNSGDYSFSAKTYNYSKANESKTYSASEYIKNLKNVNDFQLTINENTTSIIKYDKRTDPYSYIIKLNYDVTKIDQEYYNAFVQNGTGETKFSSIVITIKINKKTGFISRLERDELFQTKFAGISINCSARGVQIYSEMNISCKPFIQDIYNKSFANL